jgi:hypothetical protein
MQKLCTSVSTGEAQTSRCRHAASHKKLTDFLNVLSNIQNQTNIRDPPSNEASATFNPATRTVVI